MDDKITEEIKQEILKIKERLRAIEKEQRWIREDIIKGSAQERMKKRIFNKPKNIEKIRKKIDDEIQIKI